ncbi:hypothetical protein B0H10DRAFT_765139 [Mycena sp. CBHHK59/15]|nr:hypothetical protein B0H10DRAFT_765139 [Mycena sp. CBHHK59/15]
MQAQLQVEGPDLPTWDPQPLAPQSAHLFPHATGFDIIGGQFVSGDVHNHMGAPRSRSSVQRSLTLPAPVTSATDRETTPLPCLDPASDLLSESEFYCSQLLRKKRGFPLYVPGPPRNLPEEYRRRGVAIGDVGRVTPEGVFDFFFNIYLPSDHPINANVPDDFSPLSPYASVDVVPLDHDPGNCVLTPTVNSQELDLDTPSDDFPGGEFHFACSGPKGAVLALPYGSHLDKLENLESVRRYVANHAESWYKYVNGARGRGLPNGSLYLVTGCEKSSSGGMASYQNAAAENEFQLSFKPTADADSGYKHRWSRGRACTKYFSGPPPVDGSPLNQTVFIHGYKIGLGTGIWGAIFGTVDICELADSRVGEGRGDFVAHHAQSSLFSWSSGCLGSGTTSGTKHYAGPGGGDVFMTDSSPASKIFHPSEIINEYLLREVSDS